MITAIRHDLYRGNKYQVQKAKLQVSSANISLNLVSWVKFLLHVKDEYLSILKFMSKFKRKIGILWHLYSWTSGSKQKPA